MRFESLLGSQVDMGHVRPLLVVSLFLGLVSFAAWNMLARGKPIGRLHGLDVGPGSETDAAPRALRKAVDRSRAESEAVVPTEAGVTNPDGYGASLLHEPARDALWRLEYAHQDFNSPVSDYGAGPHGRRASAHALVCQSVAAIMDEVGTGMEMPPSSHPITLGQDEWWLQSGNRQYRFKKGEFPAYDAYMAYEADLRSYTTSPSDPDYAPPQIDSVATELINSLAAEAIGIVRGKN